MKTLGSITYDVMITIYFLFYEHYVNISSLQLSWMIYFEGTLSTLKSGAQESSKEIAV
jgi:hypothetical protein